MWWLSSVSCNLMWPSPPMLYCSGSELVFLWIHRIVHHFQMEREEKKRRERENERMRENMNVWDVSVVVFHSDKHVRPTENLLYVKFSVKLIVPQMKQRHIKRIFVTPASTNMSKQTSRRNHSTPGWDMATCLCCIMSSWLMCSWRIYDIVASDVEVFLFDFVKLL